LGTSDWAKHVAKNCQGSHFFSTRAVVKPSQRLGHPVAAGTVLGLLFDWGLLHAMFPTKLRRPASDSLQDPYRLLFAVTVLLLFKLSSRTGVASIPANSLIIS
jgi:hypothetical protein